jgi:chromate transporter
VVLVVALGTIGQVVAIALGGLAGLAFCQADAGGDRVGLAVPVPRGAAIACLAVFVALLVGLPLLRDGAASGAVAVADAFYRSGALVFGGGHVVLPMLQAEVVRPGWVSDASFLAGYGAAQALPGPLFTFAAYLGAAMQVSPGGLVAAGIALLAIFLPGLLLVTGVLPFWDRLRRHTTALAAMRGANASVVGILAAALYDPVWTSAILAPRDFAAALVGFVLLTVWRVTPLAVVVLGAVAGILMAA